MKLHHNIIPLSQPCDHSCVPTCLAMAFGKPVDVILGRLSVLGITVKNKGMESREVYRFLTSVGVGYETFLNTHVGLLQGHYLATVCSLNFKSLLHCILVHVYLVEEENRLECAVYDPNEARADREYYKRGSFLEIGPISFTKLDDFGDMQ